MMQKTKTKIVISGLILLSMLSMIQAGSATPLAYTDAVTITAMNIVSTTQATYEAEVPITWTFRFNDNYTTIKFFIYIRADGQSTNLNTKVYTYSSYVNGTSGTSGLVSVTQTLYIDEALLPSSFAKTDDIISYVYAYNATVAAANVIESDTETDDYPFVVVAAAASTTTTEGTSIWTYVIGGGALVLAFFVGMICYFAFLGAPGAEHIPVIGSRFANAPSVELQQTSTKTGRTLLQAPNGQILVNAPGLEYGQIDQVPGKENHYRIGVQIHGKDGTKTRTLTAERHGQSERGVKLDESNRSHVRITQDQKNFGFAGAGDTADDVKTHGNKKKT
jgi:hypothetical protein